MSQVKVMDRKVYYAGDTIFREGEDGSCAYLIQDGSVEIFKPQRDGTAKVLAVIGKGSIFGEMALIDSKPRMASAVAQEQTTLIIINQQQFADRMAKADPFVKGLLNILVSNVRAMSK